MLSRIDNLSIIVSLCVGLKIVIYQIKDFNALNLIHNNYYKNRFHCDVLG